MMLEWVELVKPLQGPMKCKLFLLKMNFITISYFIHQYYKVAQELENLKLLVFEINDERMFREGKNSAFIDTSCGKKAITISNKDKGFEG